MLDELEDAGLAMEILGEYDEEDDDEWLQGWLGALRKGEGAADDAGGALEGPGAYRDWANEGERGWTV